jgi:protein ImuB
MRRVVSVWLPDWPITAWRRARTASAAPPDPAPAQPFVLVGRTGAGVTLHAVNAPARALGLRPGQPHAAARAIAPGLASAPAEPAAAGRALRALALWFERFSPVAAVGPGEEGLWLDMTGGAHLFGGESALVHEIRGRLAAAGIPARVALADTPGGAWALARFSGEATIIAPAGGARDALAPLPVAALRLDETALRLLGRLGLRRIGDLYPMPRSGLARRFRGDGGLALVRRLDQALGLEAEPLTPERASPDYRARRVFAEPLIDTPGVDHILPELTQALALHLDQDGMGARVVALDAFRVDGRVTRLEAALSAPSRTASHILRLLRTKGLENLDLGFGADALTLTALVAEPLSERQGQWFAGQGQDPGALAGLIDRLHARLGEAAVRGPAPVESWLPERSERWLPVDPAPPQESPRDSPPGHRARPLLLLDPPERIETIAALPDSAPSSFVWRRASHRVTRAQGPERLGAEWWRPATTRGPHRTRDYYAVEDQAGRRFWLFRDGLYGRKEDEEIGDKKKDTNGDKNEDKKKVEPPTWWLHGMFP